MKRGFTIVEIIIVVVVLGILISLVGAAAVAQVNKSKAGEAKSETMAIKAALEKYYVQNNEYPSMQQLVGSGNGRNLTAAQYQTIANTLGVSTQLLTGGNYKFVPCWVSGALCCTINGLGECELPTSDSTNYIIYMTRTASDVAAGNVDRKYRAFSSGCSHTLLAPTRPEENGYTGFFLMYLDPSDTNWWTAGRVTTGDRGRVTRGDWCVVNYQL